MNLRLWLTGLRPKTLPASIAPVLVGAALAVRRIEQLGTCIEIYPVPAECLERRALQSDLAGRFWPVAVLCVIVALFLQIAVNYANDYSDGIRGTDDGRDADETSATANKPQRLVASGVPSKYVLAAAVIAAAITCAAGVTAILIAQGWWLFAVGTASLIAGWFYTGGKHPYGYAGFGEVGVFLFFGLAAVLGTEYALTGSVDALGALGAVCCGLNAAILLMVNNLRDMAEDRQHGKYTLAVRLGKRRAVMLFIACCVGAWLLGLYVCVTLWMPWGGILPFAGIAVSVRLMLSIFRHQFRAALGAAGCQTLLFAIAVGVAVVL
ncbi:1,4-dihydroxy-2-naphthoate octaprenyltransferase [Bifidobacterium olomucense]|uniref:1,4-dihydroxy-2-naphthoate octaprenyltransferase n=1 Tax=Bifidobacterium olomucense TaxID=2675324 RepID=A0A7Y0EVM2_9BIFI|nr:1,4-dihydroxy-2-naphthoate octaprenyltransferase [Bifidobacterium sp. DSM 109959]NMM97270.1 1,4-dihydroxy-2-naphthoate octaprenyltransferase [Bifidobacterium sp. DSM 109959]